MKSQVHIDSIPQLRNWLRKNHKTQKEVWVPVLSKDPDGMSYLGIVEAALCFGWIDSTTKNDGSIIWQRISPRNPNSNWTELDKQRVRRLQGLGLMTKAGEAVLPDMDPNSFQIEEDILKRIKEDKQIQNSFIRQPNLYNRVKIDDIHSAPTPDSREARLQKFLRNTKQGVLYGDWNDNGRLN